MNFNEAFELGKGVAHRIGWFDTVTPGYMYLERGGHRWYPRKEELTALDWFPGEPYRHKSYVTFSREDLDQLDEPDQKAFYDACNAARKAMNDKFIQIDSFTVTVSNQHPDYKAVCELLRDRHYKDAAKDLYGS